MRGRELAPLLPSDLILVALLLSVAAGSNKLPATGGALACINPLAALHTAPEEMPQQALPVTNHRQLVLLLVDAQCRLISTSKECQLSLYLSSGRPLLDQSYTMNYKWLFLMPSEYLHDLLKTCQDLGTDTTTIS